MVVKRRTAKIKVGENDIKRMYPPKPKTVKELVFDTICESENGLTPAEIQLRIKRNPRRIREHTHDLKVAGRIVEEKCRCGHSPVYRRA